jgi:catechol 2,3-dioxygenase-like lactoylglutathione lyase family enzyme
MDHAPPPPEQQITFLYTENLAACCRFYAEVLCLPLVQEQARCTIFATTPGQRSFLGICLATGPRQGTDATEDARRQGGVVLTLVSPAVEAWHGWLVAKGVPVDFPPALSADGRITHFFFRDPAGYLLEIQRFEDPLWPAPA